MKGKTSNGNKDHTENDVLELIFIKMLSDRNKEVFQRLCHSGNQKVRNIIHEVNQAKQFYSSLFSIVIKRYSLSPILKTGDIT